MNILFKLVHGVYAWLNAGAEDNYVELGHSPVKEQFETADLVASENLLAAVPELGPDQQDLINRAIQLYPTDDNRIKWLNSIASLRNSKKGWVLDRRILSSPIGIVT
jgi:hypothetical protein